MPDAHVRDLLQVDGRTVAGGDGDAFEVRFVQQAADGADEQNLVVAHDVIPAGILVVSLDGLDDLVDGELVGT